MKPGFDKAAFRRKSHAQNETFVVTVMSPKIDLRNPAKSREGFDVRAATDTLASDIEELANDNNRTDVRVKDKLHFIGIVMVECDAAFAAKIAKLPTVMNAIVSEGRTRAAKVQKDF